MKLYPPFKVTRVKISNPNEFYDELQKIIGHGNTVLKGTITDKGFVAEKRFFHENSGRPVIRGRFEIIGTEHYLLIDLHIRKAPVIFFGIFILLVIITGLVKQSIYTIPIVITSIVFLYSLNWLLYSHDLKKTKAEMNEIIKMAAANNHNRTYPTGHVS